MKNTKEAIPPFGAAGVRPLRGLEKVCKIFGRMKCGDVMMSWDYANNCAIPEKELRADKARWAASERARWSNTPDQAPGVNNSKPEKAK